MAYYHHSMDDKYVIFWEIAKYYLNQSLVACSQSV